MPTTQELPEVPTTQELPEVPTIEDQKKNVVQYAINELNKCMSKWITMNENGTTGGKMRGARGNDSELFVQEVISKIKSETGINIEAKSGKNDKKVLLSEDKKIKKLHQVDLHIYLNNIFVAVIECKSYLDSCYYVRACDDFAIFKKFGYNIKYIVFSLEDSLDKTTKNFTDFMHNNICDKVFYMLDGKRSSNKPIYNKKYKKEVNVEKIKKFIDFLFDLTK